MCIRDSLECKVPLSKDFSTENARNCKIHSYYMISASSKVPSMYSITVKEAQSQTTLRDGVQQSTKLDPHTYHEYVFYGPKSSDNQTANIVIQRSIVMHNVTSLPVVAIYIHKFSEKENNISHGPLNELEKSKIVHEFRESTEGLLEYHINLEYARYVVQVSNPYDGSYEYSILMQSKGVHILNLDSTNYGICLLYTSPSPRDRQKSRMPSSA
eukprot:TRINITY_DN4673_c0_g2_i10.p1 TRINITY_DN4673_c0_g2~~TRINITY_DN4673_c0_g2_i10.p1  ORF type:complete len:213 (+),score=36.05 TRINITY_DN4673_c0_g2_i10:66-704(+)